jgi:hypothetical protein
MFVDEKRFRTPGTETQKHFKKKIRVIYHFFFKFKDYVQMKSELFFGSSTKIIYITQV